MIKFDCSDSDLKFQVNIFQRKHQSNSTAQIQIEKFKLKIHMVTSGLPRIGKTVERRARRSCAQGIQVGGGNTPKEWAMKRKEEEEEEEHDDLSHDPRSKDVKMTSRENEGAPVSLLFMYIGLRARQNRSMLLLIMFGTHMLYSYGLCDSSPYVS